MARTASLTLTITYDAAIVGDEFEFIALLNDTLENFGENLESPRIDASDPASGFEAFDWGYDGYLVGDPPEVK